MRKKLRLGILPCLVATAIACGDNHGGGSGGGDDAGISDAGDGVSDDAGNPVDAGLVYHDAAPDAGCPDEDTDTVCDADDVCPGFDDLQDDDRDSRPDGCDNCPGASNPDQANGDGDSRGDSCDNCPEVDNEDQARCELDPLDDRGDACDDDDDGDSALDGDDSDDCNRCQCNDTDGDSCDDCDSAGCAATGSDQPAGDGFECGDERGGNDGLCDDGDPDDDGDGCPDDGDTADCDDTACGDCEEPSDGDGCDDCASGTGGPDGATDGPDCDRDGACGASAGGSDTDDDGDGVTDQAAGGGDTADNDPASCSDLDGDSCDDCAVVNAGDTCLAGTATGGDPGDDGADADGGGFCDAADNCDLDLPETQSNGDGDAYGDVCDICQGGDDDLDGDGDSVPDFCDNCPGTSNQAQTDTDPVCGGGSEPAESGGTGDLGDACDNCDAVCNDQTNTFGIRATPVSPTAIGGADCVDSTNGYSSETDDLQLPDDGISRCFDLDDENADGTVSEPGDFSFTFFGRATDAVRISNNGYLLLYESMAECAAAGNGAGETNGFTDPQPDAGVIPAFDGTDNIVAAGWTDLEDSSLNPSGTSDPCVSLQVIGSNSSTSQILEVTWEFARLRNDVDQDQPVTMQIRLSEGSGRIEIISAPFSSNLEPGETDQMATRGVEGLYFDDVVFGEEVVGAAFLGGETATTSDDEVTSVLQLASSGVEFRTGLTTAGETAAEETGDACDNAIILPTCGDAVCHADGGESSAPEPIPEEPQEPDLYSCSTDCACGDGLCDFGEDELGELCGFCPADCNVGTVPDRDGCCGDGICDTDEGEAPVAGPPPPLLICGNCVSDCSAECCGDGLCQAGNQEDSGSCPEDC